MSSRDAATYVYRKTIFELNNEYRKNINAPSKETINKIDLLNVYIEIYKLLASKLVNPIKNYDENNSAEIKKDDKNNLIINDNLIKINSKLRVFTFNLNELKNLNLLIEILDTKIEDENRFLEILINYLKKIYKNTNLILKINEKIKNEDFNTNVDENVKNY